MSRKHDAEQEPWHGYGVPGTILPPQGDTDVIFKKVQSWIGLGFKMMAIGGSVVAFLLVNERRLATMENHIISMDSILTRQNDLFNKHEERMDRIETAIALGMKNQADINMILQQTRTRP